MVLSVLCDMSLRVLASRVRKEERRFVPETVNAEMVRWFGLEGERVVGVR